MPLDTSATETVTPSLCQSDENLDRITRSGVFRPSRAATKQWQPAPTRTGVTQSGHAEHLLKLESQRLHSRKFALKFRLSVVEEPSVLSAVHADTQISWCLCRNIPGEKE